MHRIAAKLGKYLSTPIGRCAGRGTRSDPGQKPCDAADCVGDSPLGCWGPRIDGKGDAQSLLRVGSNDTGIRNVYESQNLHAAAITTTSRARLCQGAAFIIPERDWSMLPEADVVSWTKTAQCRRRDDPSRSSVGYRTRMWDSLDSWIHGFMDPPRFLTPEFWQRHGSG